MRAKDVMSSPVITVRADMPVKEVANALIRHQISCVPVVDESGNLLGIVTEADLVELETTPDPRSQIIPPPRREGPVPRTAGEAMTRNVVALPEEADVAQAARLMLDMRVKCIPIVSGARVVGIVARRDLLKVLARSDEEIRAQLEEMLQEEVPLFGELKVDVTGGVVTISGTADRAGRRLAELVARCVPGVLDVEFDQVSS